MHPPMCLAYRQRIDMSNHHTFRGMKPDGTSEREARTLETWGRQGSFTQNRWRLGKGEFTFAERLGFCSKSLCIDVICYFIMLLCIWFIILSLIFHSKQMNPYNMYALVKQTIKRHCSSSVADFPFLFEALSKSTCISREVWLKQSPFGSFSVWFQPLKPHPNLKCNSPESYRVPLWSFPLYKEAVRTSGCSQRCQHHVRCEVVAKVPVKKC